MPALAPPAPPRRRAAPLAAPYAPAYTPWPSAAESAGPAGPRFFGPAARPLFGWYHAPTGRPRGEVVVLCPSVGAEYMTGHRALRTLAERLAADGFAALRFDWPGTGDSAGDAGDPDDPAATLAAWRAGLAAAIERARAWSGAGRVTVVGLRAGALLAAGAGPALGVDRVVLWWPPASGRQLLRELRARHALAGLDHDRYAPPDGDVGLAAGSLEAEGFVLAPGLAQALGALAFPDVDAAGPPAAEVLVLAPAAGAAGAAANALAGRGARVETRHVAGSEAMRDTPLWAALPAAAIGAAAGWLAERADAARADATAAGAPVCGMPNASTHAMAPAPGHLAGAAAALVDGVREQCVRFGPDGQVAGVLTTPAGPASGARVPVLLLHTGADHHVGPNRLWTVWARRWAREGVTTLRFDPAGLGDTPAAPGDEAAAPAPYAEGRVAEIAAAAAYLCERTGADRVALVGLCSGAYYALRAAAAGVPAARVIAVNPQLYEGHEALDRAAVEGHRAPAVLGAAARDPHRWRRLLRGETSVRAVTRLVAAGVQGVARSAAITAAQEARVLAASVRGAPSTGPLAALWRVSASPVPLCLVFSQEDEGWAYLRVQARAAWRAYVRRHRVRLHVLDHTQHTFVRAWMQRQLAELVTRELRGG